MQAMNKLIILSCLLLGQVGFSQVENNSFKSICKELDEFWKKQPSKNFTTDVNTVVFSNKDKSQITTQENGKIMAGENNSFMFSSKSSFYIQNNLFGLMIDSIEKTIYLSPIKEMNYESFQWNSLYMDSSMYEVKKTITKESVTFYVKEKMMVSQYQTMSFEFDKNNATVKKVCLNFWPANYTSETIEDESMEQPYMEMTYTTILTNGNTEAILTEMNTIVKQENKTIQVAPLYATFEIQDLRINQTSK